MAGNDVEIVVTATDKTAAAFASVRNRALRFGAGLRQTLGQAGRESGAALSDGIVRGADAASERNGRRIGRKIGGGIGKGIVGTLRKLTLPGLAGVLASALKGALSSPIIGTVVGAALVLAVTGGAMALGTAISGGIILGLGTGLAAAGTAALFHVEEVNKEWSKAEQARVKESNRQAVRLRKQWTEVSRDIVGGLKQAAQPLIPVLDVVRSTLRKVGREFQPVIESGLKIAQGPLRRFVGELGEAMILLTPAIEPVMAAFGELLDTIGPSLPSVFSEISTSIIGLAETVSENRDLIGAIFVGLLRTIPMLIDFLGLLAGAFRGTFVFTLGLIDSVLSGLQGLMEFVARIPGPWREGAAEIAASLGQTRSELDATRQRVEDFPRMVELEGNIADLEAKISEAKARLKDKSLTRPQRSAIRAEISDLKAKAAQARRELAAIKDRNVTVRTNFVEVRQVRYASGTTSLRELIPGSSFGSAHGGISGGGRSSLRRMASGGIGGGTPVLVGEQGPELVNLPFGSSVSPAGQTRSRMAQAGFGSISMAFRQGQSGGGGGGFGGMTREVMSFREALEKLSRTLFGQTRAVSAYEAAWDRARASLKDNGKRLSLTTERGRENRGALLDLAEAAREVIAAMQEQGRSSSTLIKRMAEQRREFIRLARSMGLSRSKAGAMADRLGLTTGAVRSALAESSGKASGGIAGGWTLVGERGPELARLPFGSQVVPAGQTAAMLAQGGAPAPVVLELRSSGSAIDDMLLQILRRAVRVRGGNVQLVLGRS